MNIVKDILSIFWVSVVGIAAVTYLLNEWFDDE